MKVRITLEFELDEDKVLASVLPGDKGDQEWSESMDLTQAETSGESSSLEQTADELLAFVRRGRKRTLSSRSYSRRRAPGRSK